MRDSEHGDSGQGTTEFKKPVRVFWREDAKDVNIETLPDESKEEIRGDKVHNSAKEADEPRSEPVISRRRRTKGEKSTVPVPPRDWLPPKLTAPFPSMVTLPLLSVSPSFTFTEVARI